MIEVKIPADIQEYKSKLVFGLSVRQIVAIGGALAVGVPLGVLGNGHIPADILPWMVMLLVVPFVGWGFFTYKGMRFEEFVKVYFEFNVFPQKRVYEDSDNNIFYSFSEEILEQDIIRQRIDAGEFETDDEIEWRG